ncbi:MAG: twin transmembrane helix small protein [Phenylobacterium sp.]
MDHFFTLAIPVALAAVAMTLAFGIYALFRGGDFGRSYSNKLMRLRVVMQAIAILVLLGALVWRERGF